MDSLEDDVSDIVACDALDIGTGKNTWTNEALVSRGTGAVHWEWILVRNNMRLGLIGKTIVIVHKRLFFLYKHFLVLERKSRMSSFPPFDLDK